MYLMAEWGKTKKKECWQVFFFLFFLRYMHTQTARVRSEEVQWFDVGRLSPLSTR